MCVNAREAYVNQEENIPKLERGKVIFYWMQKVIVSKKKKWDYIFPPIYTNDDVSIFEYSISDVNLYMRTMKIYMTQTFSFIHLILFDIYLYVKHINMINIYSLNYLSYFRQTIKIKHQQYKMIYYFTPYSNWNVCLNGFLYIMFFYSKSIHYLVDSFIHKFYVYWEPPKHIE